MRSRNGDSSALKRVLDRSCSIKKCSRSPLHQTAASPLQQPRTLSGLSALKIFLVAPGQDVSRVQCHLEREDETAANHSEIVFRSIDHAEAQVVSPTDMPRESDFETGPELTENLGFSTEMIS